MTILLSLVPLAVMVLGLTAIVKLAAVVYRRSRISWKHCFLYALILTVLTVAVRASVVAFDASLPIALASFIALAVHVGVGTWFFAGRATSSAGESVGWAGGARLSAVTFAIVFLLALLGSALLSHVVVPGAQP